MLDNVEYALQKLQQECAEVIHIASKCTLFGVYSIHPKTKEVNQDRLVEELKDLLVAIEILQEFGALPSIELSTQEREERNFNFYKYKEMAQRG